MTKYRKRPVMIEAVQWTGANYGEIVNFANWNCGLTGDGVLFIHTLEGSLRATVGDFILRGVKGEFYPCKPDIFAATYELVEDDGEEGER